MHTLVTSASGPDTPAREWAWGRTGSGSPLRNVRLAYCFPLRSPGTFKLFDSCTKAVQKAPGDLKQTRERAFWHHEKTRANISAHPLFKNLAVLGTLTSTQCNRSIEEYQQSR
jgi:hypothetical protein